GSVDVPAEGAVTALDTAEGPAMVRALRLEADQGEAGGRGPARGRGTWGGRAGGAGEAPGALPVRGGGALNTGREGGHGRGAVALGHARVRVTWDERAEGSIDAPVALLFGAGSLYNRSGAADLVKGSMASVRFEGGAVKLAMYYPMPFFRRMRVELAGAGQAL